MYELYNLYISRPDMYELYNSYMSRRDLRAAVRALCREALDGSLTMKQYQARWPQEAAQDNFLEAVDEDLVEAIVHVPISPLTKRLNDVEWRRSEQYAALLLDWLLLELDVPAEELLSFRAECADLPIEGEAPLRSAINERFRRQGP